MINNNLFVLDDAWERESMKLNAQAPDVINVSRTENLLNYQENNINLHQGKKFYMIYDLELRHCTQDNQSLMYGYQQRF